MIPGVRLPHAGLSFELHQLADEPDKVYVVHTDIDGTQTYADVPMQGEMNQVRYHAEHLKPAMEAISEKVKARKKAEAKQNRHLTPARAQ